MVLVRTKHGPKVMLNEIREMLGVDVCICRPANALKAAKTFGAQESWRKNSVIYQETRNTHGIFGPFVSYQDFCWSIRYYLFLSNQPW